jgi:hypothetical protein
MAPHQRLLLLCAFLTTGAHAQWLNYAPPGTPLTRDGKPNLAARAPRAADGKPDLSGVWMHETTSVAEVRRLFGTRFDEAIKAGSLGMEIGTQHRYVFDILLDYKPEEAMLRPDVAEALRRRASGGDAHQLCMPLGIPDAGLVSEPMRIVQSTRMTVILYESDDTHRQIYTDGRRFPKEFAQPAWLGYSVGHWERDTLVVESAGFNDKTRFDGVGHPHSEALRIIERYRRRDFGHMDVEMTFDDSQTYTKPFTIKVPYELLADSDIFESFCNENEKDRAHSAPK